MKRDIPSQANHFERTPTNRRAQFLNPWLEDFFESSHWLEDFFSREMSPNYSDNRLLSPAVDIDETSDEYIVTADLPGVKREDISIECTGNQLNFSAERKYESTDKKSERKERFFGTYQRSFTLPLGADAEKVDATYEGGVLTVRIGKAEQAKPRKIEIAERKSKVENQGVIK